MMKLPAVLNDIIWRMAFSDSYTNGWKELEALIEFRERVPPCLCACDILHISSRMFILNPFRRGTPYVPLKSVHFSPWGSIRSWLALHVPCWAIRSGMRTYPKVFLRHSYIRETSKWNRCLRYLLRLRPHHWPNSLHREKFLAFLEQLKEARPLSPACSHFPWPGSAAFERARF